MSDLLCLRGTKYRPDNGGSNTLWAGGRAEIGLSPFWLKSVFLLPLFLFVCFLQQWDDTAACGHIGMVGRAGGLLTLAGNRCDDAAAPRERGPQGPILAEESGTEG